MDASIIALIIIGVALILYITELIPIAVTSILACLALAIFGVISMGTAFAGFGNDIVFLMAGMVVIGNTLFETGVARIVGRKIIALVGGNEKVFIVVLILVATVPAAFLSNTAAAAMMLPIAAAAIAASGGRFSRRNTYMVVGIAAVTSGGLTVVGSPPQLIAQSILREGGHDTIGFFELSAVGLPIIGLLLVFYLTIGHSLQKRVFNFPEPAADESTGMSDVAHEEVLSPKDRVKRLARMWVAVAVLVFCIVGFITDLWTMGIVAMVGASVCIISGCITQKRAYQTMDWTTIIVIACSLGLSAGLDHSGAGLMIAHAVVDFLGQGVSPWLLTAALAFIAIVLTNFMSSTATAALLIPIAVNIALELGFDVKSVVLAVVIAGNISYATPVSTPPMTMMLPAGYRFMDYVKVGGLFTLLAYVLVVLLFPLVLNF
ncbi:MAG: SLC13 family permease [Defluviitaleaceae bacterium]|nr:SLC13 family permease [Defluviitaleaceae bacterium]